MFAPESEGEFNENYRITERSDKSTAKIFNEDQDYEKQDNNSSEHNSDGNEFFSDRDRSRNGQRKESSGRIRQNLPQLCISQREQSLVDGQQPAPACVRQRE